MRNIFPYDIHVYDGRIAHRESVSGSANLVSLGESLRLPGFDSGESEVGGDDETKTVSWLFQQKLRNVVVVVSSCKF